MSMRTSASSGHGAGTACHCGQYLEHPANRFLPKVARRNAATRRVKQLALSARDDSEVHAPGTDLVGVLVRHHARDLDDVIEVVRDPGREELPQRDGAELG